MNLVMILQVAMLAFALYAAYVSGRFSVNMKSLKLKGEIYDLIESEMKLAQTTIDQIDIDLKEHNSHYGKLTPENAQKALKNLLPLVERQNRAKGRHEMVGVLLEIMK